MARTKTLANLRTEAYERADVRDSYIPEAEMNRLINASLAELYDLLVSVNQDWYLSSDDITVVSGTATYALPADFWRAVGVDYQSSNTWYPMLRFNWAERNQYQDGATSRSLTRYRVSGGNLRLRPTPDWGGTVRLWYIPAPDTLTLDADTFDGVAGWEEYAIADVVIKIRSKREEDATLEVAQKKALFARIKASAATRDSGNPDRVRDVAAELIGTDLGGWE